MQKKGDKALCLCPLGSKLRKDGKTCQKESVSCGKLRAEANRGDGKMRMRKRFKEFDGKCYLFFSDSGLTMSVLTRPKRESARPYCQRFGADLVAVETAAENNFIKRVVDVEYKNRPNGADFWVLGGRRDGVGKPFTWFQ